ncbi:uncharacterized protein LOC123911359 [Trifolium pratense]|nr:uncharacterized protein LOC123911359 [Trifolium pratense]
MSDIEEVVESQGVVRYRLFDTITDPELDWVGPEPRGIASVLTPNDPNLHTVVERRRRNDPVNWLVYMLDEGQRVCSSFDRYGFAMYELVFKELRLRLSFSPLMIGVLRRLRVAPSQLHPNSWAFILAFEHLCGYRGVRPTLPLFFRIFKVQRKTTRSEDRAVPRQNWVSLKQQDDVKLFKLFTDSVRNFKERYYIVRPESSAALDNLLEPRPDLDEHGVARRDAAGRVLTRMEPKFPLSWTYAHFHKDPRQYVVRDADLSAEDRASFEDLKNFVGGFTPAVCVNRRGEIIVDEDGNPKTSKRSINTRELLECRNAEEVRICLGRMESIADRMLKAAVNERASGKGKKKKVAAKSPPRIRLGTPVAQGCSSRGGGSGTPSSVQRPPQKRAREGDRPETGMGEMTGFPVPRCYTVSRFFDMYPPVIADAEKVAILEQETDARRTQHAQDMAGVIRMMESALVLGDERDRLEEERDAFQVRIGKLKSRIVHLENDQADYEEKKKIFGDQTVELRMRTEELDAARAEVERLIAAMASCEGEHPAAAGLTTRAELVGAIAQLSADCVEGAVYAFENAKQQMMFLNPELNLVVEGMHVNGRIEGDRIVVPEGLETEEASDEEEGTEEGDRDE